MTAIISVTVAGATPDELAGRLHALADALAPPSASAPPATATATATAVFWWKKIFNPRM